MPKGFSFAVVIVVAMIFFVAAIIYADTVGIEILGVELTRERCKDSDGGINPYEKGTAKAPGGKKTDRCLSESLLEEAYCRSENDKKPRTTEVDCELGCKAATCIKPLPPFPPIY